MQGVKVKAYAKTNLALDVLGKRQDGYHEVAMVMQGIDLYDILEIEKIQGREIILTCDSACLDTGPDNLAYRAAILLQKECGLTRGVRINLSKAIPIAAGLGGGSSDAAGILLGVNTLYNLGLTNTELLILAAQLGSDVPFCLTPLTALAQGRGEIISPLPPSPPFWLVLFKPPYGVSTKEVYRHLSHVSIGKKPHLPAIIKAIKEMRPGDLFQHMGNVLEYSTYDLHPDLQEYADKIKNLGAEKVMMSGSGPTLAAFVDNEETARRLASMWIQSDWEVIIARSLQPEDLKGRVMEYERKADDPCQTG